MGQPPGATERGASGASGAPAERSPEGEPEVEGASEGGPTGPTEIERRCCRGVVGVSTGPSVPDSTPDHSGSPSRPSNGTNSVPSENSRETDSAGVGGLPTIDERISEFIEEYPELAFLEVSEKDGQKIREELAVENSTSQYVAPQTPTEVGFVVEEEGEERRALTWAAVMAEFLESHENYRNAALRLERGRRREPLHESFEVPLNDSWGEQYADQEYAKARAIEREMAGGSRPTGGESTGEWDDLVTVMLSLTASSTPASLNGERLPPIDHLREIQDAFSYGGVRDTVRNVIEKEIGLGPDEWGYWSINEPHTGGGENTCFSHSHVGIYLNIDPDEYDLNTLGAKFEKVIDKHVEETEFAGFEGHDYTQWDCVEDEKGPISVNADVGNMGSYMAAYAGNYGGELVERPVEYLAWGALHWATNSQRSRRSKTVNEAIRADLCKQEYEYPEAEQSHDHGERLTYNGHGEVVCEACESGWGISDGATVVEVRASEPGVAVTDGGDVSREEELRQAWPSARAAASLGADGEVAGFERPPEWRPTAVIKGDSEYPVSQSGGVDMVELKIPSENDPPPEFPVEGYGPPVDGSDQPEAEGMADSPPDSEFPAALVERHIENNPAATAMEVVAQTGVDPAHLDRVEELIEQ